MNSETLNNKKTQLLKTPASSEFLFRLDFLIRFQLLQASARGGCFCCNVKSKLMIEGDAVGDNNLVMMIIIMININGGHGHDHDADDDGKDHRDGDD